MFGNEDKVLYKGDIIVITNDFTDKHCLEIGIIEKVKKDMNKQPISYAVRFKDEEVEYDFTLPERCRLIVSE